VAVEQVFSLVKGAGRGDHHRGAAGLCGALAVHGPTDGVVGIADHLKVEQPHLESESGRPVELVTPVAPRQGTHLRQAGNTPERHGGGGHRGRRRRRGTINAVVGAGTLITFPTLLAFGYPPVLANVSNNIGLVPGTLSAAYGYRRELRGQLRRVLRFGAGSLLGGVIGALLLLKLPPGAFDAVVPVLILAGCALVLLQPRLGAWLKKRESHGDGGVPLWLGHGLGPLFVTDRQEGLVGNILTALHGGYAADLCGYEEPAAAAKSATASTTRAKLA
jgi:hypothetical protein